MLHVAPFSIEELFPSWCCLIVCWLNISLFTLYILSARREFILSACLFLTSPVHTQTSASYSNSPSLDGLFLLSPTFCPSSRSSITPRRCLLCQSPGWRSRSIAVQRSGRTTRTRPSVTGAASSSRPRPIPCSAPSSAAPLPLPESFWEVDSNKAKGLGTEHLEIQIPW